MQNFSKVPAKTHQFALIQQLCLTWISEGPGPVHVAYVRCDADCQDAVHQRDEATVPLVAAAAVDVAQDKVEGHPAGQGEERTDDEKGHLLV